MNAGKVSSSTVLAAVGFAAVGLFSFGLACLALLLRPDVLAGGEVTGVTRSLTHLATLGWIGSLLFAGAYLAGPQLAGSSLWSGRLPLVHFFLHVVGIGLLLAGFILSNGPCITAGAWLVFAGLLALVYNLFRTGSKRSLWTPAHLAFQAAMFWLAMSGAGALYLLRIRAMEVPPIPVEMVIALHAHFALFGFLSQVLLGVSLRVVPELLHDNHASHGGYPMAWFGWACLNGGLLALFSMVLTGSPQLMFAAGLVVAVGVAAFAAAIGRTLWHARSRVGWGMLTHATGVVMLVAITVGALATFPQAGEGMHHWMRTYISLSLLGPFALAVFGAGEHLAPRLIWRLRYAPWQKHAEVPPASRLGRAAAGGPVFFSLVMAWVYLVIGQLWHQPESIRLAAMLLLFGFGWFLTAISPALLCFIFGVTPRDLGGATPLPENPAKP